MPHLMCHQGNENGNNGTHGDTPVVMAKVQNTDSTEGRCGCGATGTLGHCQWNALWKAMWQLLAKPTLFSVIQQSHSYLCIYRV